MVCFYVIVYYNVLSWHDDRCDDYEEYDSAVRINPQGQNPLYKAKFRTAFNSSESDSGVKVFLKYAYTERCHDEW